MFRSIAGGRSIAEVHDDVVAGRLLFQPAMTTRVRIWKALNWRYFAWHPAAWVLAELADEATADSVKGTFPLLAYLHYARRDLLTFEFVTTALAPRVAAGRVEVGREDGLDFLKHAEARHPEIAKWRDATRRKLAGNALSALRDFGLVQGVQRKRVVRPHVSDAVLLHLCRLLWAEGLRGTEILRAPDWSLLFMDESAVLDALMRLDRARRGRFQHPGGIVMLEVPPHPSGGTP